ncbi:MAG: HAL/PAL/TAL family ammonia-lyase [Bacteroidota bacterium]
MIKISPKKEFSAEEFKSIVFDNKHFEIDDKSLDLVDESFNFLVNFSKDKVIYGINTGFGPMAQFIIDDADQVQLQYNLIRSHAAGVGEKIPDMYVKAAMFVRMLSIIQGYSGIHPSCVTLLKDMINNNVYPYIPEHGGVGASGDLVQLSHLSLNMIGEGQVTYKGQLKPTSEVFKELGLQPIKVVLREGLSLINGTSVMTGIGLINVLKAKHLLNWSIAASAILNELVESFDDYFSEELNSVKKHNGQSNVAKILRDILADSKMINRRESHFYNNNYKNNGKQHIVERKVQEYYSLRCVPQILGPVVDTIVNTEKILLNEMNSVSDNPVVDLETKNVYHGGNFHGDYVSLEMDKLKLAITKLSMMSERHLAFLCNSKINEKLPPFVNLGKLGLNLGMQGIQFTATSTVAENQTLSNSMYVHSISTNNDNQDIVSMGTNAAMMTKRVIDNSFQVLSIEMIALLQAVDYLGISNKLSSFTKNIYDDLRAIVPKFVEDSPKYNEIEQLTKYLFNNNINIQSKNLAS